MDHARTLCGVFLVCLACGGGGDEAGSDELGFVPGAGARQATEQARPELADTALLRETFNYAGGPRDPFLSFLAGDEGGPLLRDLQLISIVYDARFPARSLAVLRDRIEGTRYRVRRGENAGPNRVVEIRQREVVFSVQDFGFQRQETLSLPKPEERQ